MQITSINADLLAKMFLAGAKNLDAKKEWINELNVFPVPDGDTGTNMTMTIMSAAKEVSSTPNPSMTQLAKAISSGSLRGAEPTSACGCASLYSACNSDWHCQSWNRPDSRGWSPFPGRR